MDAKTYKQQLLNKLYAPYIKCFKCPLGFQGRINVVFGEGNPDADLIFVGEAPGKEEDIQGKPFVGKSGQLLNKVLELVGIQRKDVFITNTVKCKPPYNRKPMPKESQTCKNLLLKKQIKIIRPKVICTLGSAAIQGLLENYNIKITKIRGTSINWGNIAIIPTYHPAYILRNYKELQSLVNDVKKTYEYLDCQ